MKRNKTYSPKAADIERSWWLVDATDLPLGRLASEVARLLRGKHKPTFAPHMDMGDHVIVVNAERVALTAEKGASKMYFRHTGYPGGIRSETFDELKARRAEVVIERAVRGMLPKNPLGRSMLRKLRVYQGSEHPHGSQNPQTLDLGIRKVET